MPVAKLTDTSLMTYGIHSGKPMKEVPWDYLLFLLKNNRCSPSVKKYIEDKEYLLRLKFADVPRKTRNRK